MIERIETERLILRKAEGRDLDLIWERVWRQEELAGMMLWTPTPTRGEAIARLERTKAYQRDNCAYFICLKATDEPIGFGGCREIAPGDWDETGLCIAKAWQGLGYGKESLRALVELAFRELGGRRFRASCFHENAASAATIRSCGFVYAGSGTETRERDGYPYLCDRYVLDAGPEFARRSGVTGRTVTVTVDRPLGSRHPEHADLLYPVNYGFVPGVPGGDGEEQDVYILGVDRPLASFTGRVIAVIRRLDDAEDKWVAAPETCAFTPEAIGAAVDFQERFFRSELIF